MDIPVFRPLQLFIIIIIIIIFLSEMSTHITVGREYPHLSKHVLLRATLGVHETSCPQCK